MQSATRYVAIGLILGAILVSMTIGKGLEYIWTYLALENTPLLTRQFRITELIAYSIGFGSAAYVWFNAHVHQLLNEVAEELRKVTWPTRDETMSATVVVIVTVFIFAAYLGLFDAFFLWFTNLLLDIPSDVVV